MRGQSWSKSYRSDVHMSNWLLVQVTKRDCIEVDEDVVSDYHEASFLSHDTPVHGHNEISYCSFRNILSRRALCADAQSVCANYSKSEASSSITQSQTHSPHRHCALS
jgi:hypothetical protein